MAPHWPALLVAAAAVLAGCIDGREDVAPKEGDTPPPAWREACLAEGANASSTTHGGRPCNVRSDALGAMHLLDVQPEPYRASAVPRPDGGYDWLVATRDGCLCFVPGGRGEPVEFMRPDPQAGTVLVWDRVELVRLASGEYHAVVSHDERTSAGLYLRMELRHLWWNGTGPVASEVLAASGDQVRRWDLFGLWTDGREALAVLVELDLVRFLAQGDGGVEATLLSTAGGAFTRASLGSEVLYDFAGHDGGIHACGVDDGRVFLRPVRPAGEREEVATAATQWSSCRLAWTDSGPVVTFGGYPLIGAGGASGGGVPGLPGSGGDTEHRVAIRRTDGWNVTRLGVSPYRGFDMDVVGGLPAFAVTVSGSGDSLEMRVPDDPGHAGPWPNIWSTGGDAPQFVASAQGGGAALLASFEGGADAEDSWAVLEWLPPRAGQDNRAAPS